MKNRNYIVDSDEIYLGQVVKLKRIIKPEDEKEEKITVESYKPYRNILFTINQSKLSNDLIYSSPSYPILDITDEETCLNLPEDSIVIKNACSLKMLLRNLDYPGTLNYEEIINIKKLLFYLSGNYNQRDIFKPSNQEGQIKKLTRR